MIKFIFFAPMLLLTIMSVCILMLFPIGLETWDGKFNWRYAGIALVAGYVIGLFCFVYVK